MQMNKISRQALGKGLASLIPQSGLAQRENEGYGEIINLDINKVHPNPNQPRTYFSDQELVELSSSIREFGVIQPIIVNIDGDQYLIVAGERRWNASKKAGLSHIPAIIKSMDGDDILKTSIIENIQRQDLTSIEEARAYNKLMKQYNYTQEDLSKKLCKSRSHIANLLRLLHLPLEVQDMIEKKSISAGHAKVLLGAKAPLDLAKAIVDKNLNVRQAEAYLKEERGESRDVNQSTKRVSHLSKLHANNKLDYELTKDQDIIDIEVSLSDALGSKVQIVEKSFGGQVIIDFYNLDQLDAIINQLSVKKSWI